MTEHPNESEQGKPTFLPPSEGKFIRQASRPTTGVRKADLDIHISEPFRSLPQTIIDRKTPNHCPCIQLFAPGFMSEKMQPRVWMAQDGQWL
jgi:hypothetical protein